MSQVVQAVPSASDFDFWPGRWRVHNRYLRRRLAGSDEWDEFEATVVARALPGGLGNEDEFHTEYQGGFVGMSFRFFDPVEKRWAIYWADTRRPGELDPPVFGTFDGDVGVFEGEDLHRGRPVLVRFTWSGVTTPTPRWEQAFSDDGGVTWETNWVMEFTPRRTPPSPGRGGGARLHASPLPRVHASLGFGTGASAAASPSCGGSMVMFGRIRSSQRGMYHVFSPSHVKKAGTRVIRTTSASVRIAAASNRPNSFEMRSDVRMNAAKTVPMMIAAATTTRPIAAIPCSTASRVFRPCTCSSRMRLIRKTM